MVRALIPIEMAFTNYYENESAKVWLATEMEIDPANYPGLTQAYFGGTFSCGSTSSTPGEVHPAQLVDEDGAVYATINTIAGNTSATWNPKRYRSTFTLNAAKKKYYFKTNYGGSEWGRLSTRHVQMILEGDFSKVRIQIPLMSGDESNPGGSGDGDVPAGYDELVSYCARSSKTTYGYNDLIANRGTDPQHFVIFRKDDSKWDHIDSWDFEVMGGLRGVLAGYFELYNLTKSLSVTGSEIEFLNTDNPASAELCAYIGVANGCLPIRKTVSIANDAENFDDGDDFLFRMRAPSAVNRDTAVLGYSICLYANVS